MKITCRHCGATYNVNEDKIPDSGAKVRCKKCQNSILVEKPGPAPEPEPKPEQPKQKAAPPPPTPPPQEDENTWSSGGGSTGFVPPGAKDGEFKTGGYIKEAWGLYKSNFMAFTLGNFLLMIINSFAFGLLIGPWYAGMYKMTIKARHGQDVSMGDAFSGFENFGLIFVAGLLYSIGVGLGSALCFIPGLIVGGILMYLIPLVALRGDSIGDAIGTSKEIAMKSLVAHSLFMLVIVLLAMLGAILCGVGLFITVPIGIMAMGVAYDDQIGG